MDELPFPSWIEEAPAPYGAEAEDECLLIARDCYERGAVVLSRHFMLERDYRGITLIHLKGAVFSTRARVMGRVEESRDGSGVRCLISGYVDGYQLMQAVRIVTATEASVFVISAWFVGESRGAKPRDIE